MTWLVLAMGLADGCASELPVVPGEESTGEGEVEPGSSGDAESSDTGIEAGCGNGIVEAGETCDEQGATPTCDGDCTPVDCGDGLVNEAAGEECDEGGATETCNLDCTRPRCGDGVINVEGEECDDGVASAFCDGDCTVAECGDGVVNALADEECDDAGRTEVCNADCTLAECGDGVVNEAAGEACDGGGETADCNASCSVAECGDGIVNVTAAEACDDMGASAACDVDCTAVECGDTTINALAGEICEVTDLVGESCEGLGYGIGTLTCPGCMAYETSGCTPSEPVLSLSFSPVKRFDFSWGAAMGAEYYQVLESAAPGEPFVQVGGDVVGESVSVERPLHLRWEASYVLRACNAGGCTDSAVVDVVDSLAEAVGYFKASNTEAGDLFGASMALSDDGNTLVVGAYHEDSNATGIGGDQADNSAGDSGAVYVFVKDGVGTWSQQAYLKPSTTGAGDVFGDFLALSGDGNTLAVGAWQEDSNATGIGGTQADDSAVDAGAVFVFVRDGLGVWSQQAYVKASNTGANDHFGSSVALSVDGNTLAVGARFEDSNATGIGASQLDNSSVNAGAVYVFVRDGLGGWSQQAYVKASNNGANDEFGFCVVLSGDGNTLAVTARYEDSNATGIGGTQADNSVSQSGAVYVFVRDGLGGWSQQAYVKPSNTGVGDVFGYSVALSGDGNTLAVCSYNEDSNATGIGGNQADNSAVDAGAVYVFVRDGMGSWSQQAYVKASNTGAFDRFGYDLVLSDDGNTLAVVAPQEDSNATGIGGAQADDSALEAGAAYVFVRDGVGEWSQQAYVKAPNTGANDRFGWSVELNGNGDILAVGVRFEDSNAAGIGGTQADDSAVDAGAVYLY